jgi:hypothetical protein
VGLGHLYQGRCPFQCRPKGTFVRCSATWSAALRANLCGSAERLALGKLLARRQRRAELRRLLSEWLLPCRATGAGKSTGRRALTELAALAALRATRIALRRPGVGAKHGAAAGAGIQLTPAMPPALVEPTKRLREGLN